MWIDYWEVLLIQQSRIRGCVEVDSVLFIFRAALYILCGRHTACCSLWLSRLYVVQCVFCARYDRFIKSVFCVNPAYSFWPWALVSVTGSLSSPPSNTRPVFYDCSVNRSFKISPKNPFF